MEQPNKFLSKRLFRLLLIYYLVAYIIDFIGILLIYNQTENTNTSFGELGTQYLIVFVSKLSYILLALILIGNFFKKNILSLWIVLVHLVLAALLSFYTAYIGLLVDVHLFSRTDELTVESIYIRGLGGLSFNFFVYFSMIAIVYAYNYLQRKKIDDLRTTKLKAELLDSKVRALQSQLNPHFLFNSLNDISSLIDHDKTKAQNAIADLSDLLRKTLSLRDSKLISLKEELDLLETYIQMEKLRYDDKWVLLKSIPKELEDYSVPPLFLQPFLENTIKHGFSEEHQKIKTFLKVSRNDHYLKIDIINDGKSLQSEPPIIGTGIGNILARLDSLFKGDFEFDIFNDSMNDENYKGSIVRASIQLPLLKSSI